MKNLKRNIGTILLGIIVILHIVFIHLKISNVESKIPTDYVPRIEYDLKDQMIRQTLHNIQSEVEAQERELIKLKEAG
jgi:hypothetical protein